MPHAPKLDFWVQARVTPQHKRVLEAISRERGVDVAQVVREALAAFTTQQRAPRLRVSGPRIQKGRKSS